MKYTTLIFLVPLKNNANGNKTKPILKLLFDKNDNGNTITPPIRTSSKDDKK
jgi:hypothetical protein